MLAQRVFHLIFSSVHERNGSILCFSLNCYDFMKFAGIQSVLLRPICCANNFSLVCFESAIRMSSSATHQRRRGGRTPLRGCSPRERPPWSLVVSRRKPYCSGNLAGTHWQPEIKKKKQWLATQTSNKILIFYPKSCSCMYLYHIKTK